MSQGKVFKTTITPHWFQNDTRFWYRNDLKGGAKEFVLVDAEAGKRTPAFDHQKLSAALGKAAGKEYGADRLPFDSIEFVDGMKSVRFRANGATWQCDLTSYECARSRKEMQDNSPEEDDEVEDAAESEAAPVGPGV